MNKEEILLLQEKYKLTEEEYQEYFKAVNLLFTTGKKATEKPKLVFTTTELLISIKAMEIHYSMKDIDKLSYEVVNTAGIVTIKAENKIEYADGAILYSSKKNEQLAIYDAKGVLVRKTKVLAGENGYMSLSGLSAGLYVITIGNTSYKVYKK